MTSPCTNKSPDGYECPQLFLRLLFVFISYTLPAHAQNGTLDLTRLHNYANQPRPAYIQKDNTPAGNPITDLGATLGRVLFYDKRLSRNNTVSCASCHQQDRAFGDTSTASTGVGGTTGRHSMRLINSRFAGPSAFFWDKRAPTLEAQSTQPIHDEVEMGFSDTNGNPSFTDLINRLSAIEQYQVLFTAVYGTPVINETRIQNAIAQFIRSIQSFDSKYDAGRSTTTNDTDPFPNFTSQENAGKTLFLTEPGDGGAGCAACHQPPEFDIDPFSRNNGIITSISGAEDLTNTRSPTLRDLVDTSGNPHSGVMHDASLPTLLDVVNHYNAIPNSNSALDIRLKPTGSAQELELTQTQKNNLVAFLKTLTGSKVYTDPKWSDPFDTTGALTLIVLPLNIDSITFNGTGATRQATVTAQGVPFVDYTFQTSSDMKTWTSTLLTAPASGILSMTVPAPQSAGHQYYRYTYTP